MNIGRQVIVFDAADLDAESAFWAGMLGGYVFEDDDWHSVIDAAGEWRIGVQRAPDHVPPGWPHGTWQQVHLDLHVDDPRAAHEEAIALGAQLLQPGPDFDAAEGHQVYADPAGHPFCIGWGHPSREALAAFVADRLRGREPSQGTYVPSGTSPGRNGPFGAVRLTVSDESDTFGAWLMTSRRGMPSC